MEIDWKPPASPEEIERYFAQMRSLLGIQQLPDDLRTVWMRSNGFSADEVYFYSLDETLERNELLEVAEFAPGYLTVANDGGSRIALLDTRAAGSEVLLNYMGDMDPGSMERTEMSLPNWIDAGCPFELEPPPLYSALDKVIVRLDKIPSDGLRGLMRIRKVLNLEIPVIMLTSLSKQLPYDLCELWCIPALHVAAELNQKEVCVSLWRADNPSEAVFMDYDF